MGFFVEEAGEGLLNVLAALVAQANDDHAEAAPLSAVVLLAEPSVECNDDTPLALGERHNLVVGGRARQ